MLKFGKCKSCWNYRK